MYVAPSYLLACRRVGTFQADFSSFLFPFLLLLFDRFESFEIKSDDYLEDPRANSNGEGLLW